MIRICGGMIAFIGIVYVITMGKAAAHGDEWRGE